MTLLKINWLVPIVFAIVCGAFSYLSMYTEYDHLRVLNQNAALTSDAEKTWDVKLGPGKMYTIEIESKVKAFDVYSLNIELSLDGNTIFSLEDGYWHEFGTWSEGGESGSWEESNASTLFKFRVKKKGIYKMKLGLSDEGRIPNTRLTEIINAAKAKRVVLSGDVIKQLKPVKLKRNFNIKVKESNPIPLGWWPFAVASFIFFFLGFYIFFKRETYFVKALYKYDVGTHFEIDGKDFEVTQVADYFYLGEHWSTEFTLKGDSPVARYLSADKFELEKGESTTIYHKVLLSQPLSNNQNRTLATSEGSAVSLDGKTFVYDSENSDTSGTVKRIIVKNGVPYLNKVYSELYHLSDQFPTKPGQVWLDCSYDEVEWGAEEIKEWTLSEVQNWKKVLITEAIKRKGPPFTPHTMVSEET